jgi:transcriptional regulator with XRE-family HTH domain
MGLVNMDAKTRIKALMDERGWTVYELAKRSGLSQTTLANLWKRNN